MEFTLIEPMGTGSRITKTPGVCVAVPFNAGQATFSQHPYYQALFELNPALQLLVDPVTWRIVDANPAIAHFYGYSQEHLRQITLAELTVVDSDNNWPAELLHHLAGLGPDCLYQRQASGCQRRVRLAANSIDLAGQVLLLISLTEVPHSTPGGSSYTAALTDLLQAIAQRLRQTTDLVEVLQPTVVTLQQILNADRVLVCRLAAGNRTGTIIAEACHPPLAPLLGWTISDMGQAGTRSSEAVHAVTDIHESDLDPAVVELLERFSVRSCLSVPLFQGDQVWGRLIAHQCCTQRSWQPEEIELLQNLELQLGVALALNQLGVLKNDFLSTVSHELRTPLSGIKTSAELLQVIFRQLASQSIPTDLYQRAVRYLDILQGQCDREIELVTDILTLQQLEAGTQPFISSHVQLQYWIPQVLDTFEDRLQHQQQTLHCSISPRIPAITTDLFMFNRILGELLTNACKFTPTGGEITLDVDLTATVEPVPPGFQIRILNTGIEIPAAEQVKIFQPFYRIPSADPWKHGGTGVGLALVKKLVGILGGSIWIETVSGATCFVVQLPIESQPT